MSQSQYVRPGDNTHDTDRWIVYRTSELLTPSGRSTAAARERGCTVRGDGNVYQIDKELGGGASGVLSQTFSFPSRDTFSRLNVRYAQENEDE